MFMMTIKKNNKRIAGLVIMALVFSLVVPADMPAKKSKRGSTFCLRLKLHK